MAADDDHVCALRLGGIDRDGSGVAFPDEELRRDSPKAGVLDDPGERRFTLGTDLVDTSVEEAARQPETRRIDDAQEDHLRPDPRRQLDAGSLGAGRCRARICRDKDKPRAFVGVCRGVAGNGDHERIGTQPVVGMTHS